MGETLRPLGYDPLDWALHIGNAPAVYQAECAERERLAALKPSVNAFDAAWAAPIPPVAVDTWVMPNTPRLRRESFTTYVLDAAGPYVLGWSPLRDAQSTPE